MEPELTKQISSNTVCTYYGILAYGAAAIAIVAFLGTLTAAFVVKMPFFMKFQAVFLGLLVTALAIVSSLFQYLVCTRALLGEQKVILKKEGFRY